MKLLRHILIDYTNIQLFCGNVFLRCGYAKAVFSVDDLYIHSYILQQLEIIKYVDENPKISRKNSV